VSSGFFFVATLRRRAREHCAYTGDVCALWLLEFTMRFLRQHAEVITTLCVIVSLMLALAIVHFKRQAEQVTASIDEPVATTPGQATRAMTTPKPESGSEAR
jgi:hypothetical protein